MGRHFLFLRQPEFFLTLREGETSGVNLNQIVLMSLQIIKTEFRTDLSHLKAIKVLKIK